MDANVAIGNYAGENNQRIGSIAVGALAGNNAQEQFALAVGLQAGRTQQGWHSIALGHKAGFNMPARAPFPPGTFDAQSRNSIIVNAGDPKNTNPTVSDWGPLQAISGSSSACGATINAAGSGYAIGVATTTTAGAGHGFIINILSVNGGAIVTFGIVSCGSGYVSGDTVTVTGGNNDAVLSLNDREIFPAPAAGASAAEIACIQNQGSQADMPASAGQPVTGFFVNPVRNVGGGFVMAYDPCTKEIKYNASKAIGDLPDLDDGDCYSEYLYWDDGLGTAYAGDPGWKVGGGPLTPTLTPIEAAFTSAAARGSIRQPVTPERARGNGPLQWALMPVTLPCRIMRPRLARMLVHGIKARRRRGGIPRGLDESIRARVAIGHGQVKVPRCRQHCSGFRGRSKHARHPIGRDWCPSGKSGTKASRSVTGRATPKAGCGRDRLSREPAQSRMRLRLEISG